MKKPKLRELREAVKSLFSRPFTTKFPAEPVVPAKGFRGKPQFSQENCIGCIACANVCPAGAIEVEDVLNQAGPVRRLTHIPARCIFCQECEKNCITGEGIKLTDQFDVSYFDEKAVNHSVEHDLVLCSHCGEIVGTLKHILWLARRLGPMSFSQASYIEFTQKSLGIQDGLPGEKVGKDTAVDRNEIFNVTCPKCRRAVYLEDEKIRFTR